MPRYHFDIRDPAGAGELFYRIQDGQGLVLVTMPAFRRG
jgi:hypothetical protein